MNIEQMINEKSQYLGYFKVDGDKMPFVRRENIRRKDIIALGDIVYFMYVDNKLMKIGKAGGKLGFAGRINTYQQGRGPYGDMTNKRIMDVMDLIDQSKIDVYAVSCPREIVKFECPLTGNEITEEVTTHQNTEKRLTHQYLAECANNELPFCNQIG
jgi:hypothetical protein